MKRLLLSLVALAAVLGIAHAVNITGTNSQSQNQIVSVGYIRNSVTDAITATAGGGLANAVALDSAYNRVTTVATAGDSVKLPLCQSGPVGGAGLANTLGMMIYVTNAATPNSMNVFPSTGGSINALATNAAYAMATGKTAGFLCSPGGTIWYSILGG